MKDPNDGFSHKLKFHVILMIQKSMSMEQTPIDVDNESVGCLPYNVDANSSRKKMYEWYGTSKHIAEHLSRETSIQGSLGN